MVSKHSSICINDEYLSFLTLQILHKPFNFFKFSTHKHPHKLDLVILATCFMGYTSKFPFITLNPLRISYTNKNVAHMFSSQICFQLQTSTLDLLDPCNVASEPLHNRNPPTQQNNPIQNIKKHTYHKSTKDTKQAYISQIRPYNQTSKITQHIKSLIDNKNHLH